jgi:lipopolysaccharide/colanic/teichoic acid biosynthesis glycosyltransferase/choline kinase
MDALILAGGHGTDLQPLTLQRPKHLLPIANRPALTYALEALRRAGFLEIGLTVNGDESQYREALGDGSQLGVRLTYLRETAPKGTAGCLRAVLEDPQQGRLLVLNANLIFSVDLGRLVSAHQERGAVATVAVVVSQAADAARRPQREHLRLAPDGALLDLSTRYASPGGDPEWRPVGVYLFEREALERIPEGVYCDLKEQFLPELLEAGLPVFTHTLIGYLAEIDWVEDYLRAQFDVLRGCAALPPAGEELVEGAWVKEGVDLAPDAVLVGPLALGAGVRVGAGARLIGPLVVGEGSDIGAGALVRDSVLGAGVRVGSGARIERSILIDGVQVADATRVEDSVVAWKTLKLGHLNLVQRDLRIRSASLPMLSYLRMRSRRRIYGILKRAFDLALASAASIALLPVMACVALAIRLDSKGPILFRQARCGRGGRKFQMLKFRSMREEAAELQGDLRALNESDGPVFKITNDPRLTRVGRILRNYSLDELPQLWNVLTGDMSIVGPRPLAEEELRLCPSWRDARLQVKPGLTGLWQVNSREKNAFNAWIRQDLRYVRNQSFLLDMSIVLRTVTALTKGL